MDDTLTVKIIQSLVELRDNTKNLPRNDELAFVDYCLKNLHYSRAQLLQDLFVLNHLHEKPSGFFVEFGATNGIELSNTYQLEKRFLWSGILAEPARCWHNALRRNRNCAIDTRCVWEASDQSLEFNQVAADISTINAFSGSDGHAAARKRGELYQVETVSLVDLLVTHGAPRIIDYLSIDTEGSEPAILSAFDFDRFDIRMITVEHNYTAARGQIFTLLSSKGYTRVFEKFSRWDDWYVRQ